MKLLSKLLFLFSVTCFLSVTLIAREVEETFKKNIDIESATRLTVENSNGSIEISTWNRNEVGITAYKKVRAGSEEDALKLLESLEIDIIVHNDEIEVITKYPHSRHRGGGDDGFFGWIMGKSSYISYSVSYEIKVPDEFNLDLNSTNGRIEVDGTNGKMRLSTTNGKIIGNDVSGSAKCSTTNGSINVSFRNVAEEDEMSFTSTNGSIKLYLPADIKADVKAKTTNGSVKCDLPITDKYGRSKKLLDAEINGGGDLSIYIKTTNGSIKIDES